MVESDAGSEEFGEEWARQSFLVWGKFEWRIQRQLCGKLTGKFLGGLSAWSKQEKRSEVLG